jgi:hypothetical protein|tara:strand:- start:5803 stop:5976 length:174 start_codon:yes stop_codon:yes gene_type:complete
MSNNVNIYYDGDSFCQATAIFTDPNLTTYAPSLWYAFGGQKRLWRLGQLLLEPCQPC